MSASSRVQPSPRSGTSFLSERPLMTSHRCTSCSWALARDQVIRRWGVEPSSNRSWSCFRTQGVTQGVARYFCRPIARRREKRKKKKKREQNLRPTLAHASAERLVVFHVNGQQPWLSMRAQTEHLLQRCFRACACCRPPLRDTALLL